MEWTSCSSSAYQSVANRPEPIFCREVVVNPQGRGSVCRRQEGSDLIGHGVMSW